MHGRSRRATRALAATVVGATTLLWGGGVVGAAWSPTDTSYTVNGGNGVDLAPDGSVWVVSAFDNVVYKYSPRGQRLLTVGSFGTAPGQFNLPSALTVGPDGDVYVTDVGGRRVQRFTADGAYVRSYGDPSTLSNPRGVAVTAEGDVIVGDAETGIRRFAGNGTYLRNYPAVSKGFAVAVDASGAIWASDFSGSRDTVHKLDGATGAVLLSIGGFGQPADIELDDAGHVHIFDFNSSTVRTYDSAGALLETSARMENVIAIAVDDDERLVTSGLGGTHLNLPDPTSVTPHLGPDGAADVEATYAAATAGQTLQTIDFDGDGFDTLAPHTFMAIPTDHYADLGVQLIGLDARSVGTQPWSHSPPIGAWQAGFNSHPAQPYSLVFADPVASVGFFAHDVEGQIIATVQLTDGHREFFRVPAQQADGGRFIGVTAADDVIASVEFDSADFHIIDDVRFGRIDPPASDTTPPVITVTSPQDGQTVTRHVPLALEFECVDDGGSGIASCTGPVAPGGALDTSATGSFPVVVEAVDAAGNRSERTVTYQVVPAPFSITSVAPNARPRGSTGQVLTVTGDGFVAGTTARITGGGVTVTSATVVSETTMELTVDIGAGAAIGPKNVVITKPGTPSATCTGCLTVVARPAISLVDPASRPQGTDHATLTVSGSGFQPGATASLAGSGVTVHGATVVDATRIDLDVSVAATATIGTRALTITNPDGAAVTRTSGLTVRAAPTVSATNPAGLRAGRTLDVAITGTGFAADFVTAGGSVNFGDGIVVNAVTRTSASRLSANVTVAVDAAAGPRTVVVRNPDGGQGTCAGCTSVAVDPVIAAVGPNAAPRGAAGLALSIDGSGFASGAVVSIPGGGVTVANTSVAAGQITAAVTIGGSAALGARDVVVTNPDTGTTTCIGCFVVNAKPTISGVAPATAPRGATAHAIVVSGTGFQPGAVVALGGAGVTVTVEGITPTSITVRLAVAAGAPTGNRSLTVTNPDGGSVTRATGVRIT